MIYPYNGHHSYDRPTISYKAPEAIGVYYCGAINTAGNLVPYYIGRAMGEGVSISSRLLDHLRENNWPGVAHFGYCICTTQKEAEEFEKSEIQKFQPRYNTQGKSY